MKIKIKLAGASSVRNGVFTWPQNILTSYLNNK